MDIFRSKENIKSQEREKGGKWRGERLRVELLFPFSKQPQSISSETKAKGKVCPFRLVKKKERKRRANDH